MLLNPLIKKRDLLGCYSLLKKKETTRVNNHTRTYPYPLRLCARYPFAILSLRLLTKSKLQWLFSTSHFLPKSHQNFLFLLINPSLQTLFYPSLASLRPRLHFILSKFLLTLFTCNVNWSFIYYVSMFKPMNLHSFCVLFVFCFVTADTEKRIQV